jgi:hypothetical protein
MNLIIKLCEHWLGKTVVQTFFGWSSSLLGTFVLFTVPIALHFCFIEGPDPYLPPVRFWIQFVIVTTIGVLFLIAGYKET